MPARMPWRTQIVGPSFDADAVDPPPDDAIKAVASGVPYGWNMAALQYSGALTGHARFGHADQTAAQVTSMPISGNDGGVLAANNDGLLVAVAAFGSATLTVADSVPGQTWDQLTMGAVEGCRMFVFRTVLKAHAAGDVITVTSDNPTQMIGAVYQLTNPGLAFSCSLCNGGFSTQAWAVSPGEDGEVVSMIASPDGRPQDPAGYQSVGSLLGASLPLFFTVSRGMP